MRKEYNYDYTELRARIKKKYGTMVKFAEAMGCPSSTLSMRINNKAEWPQGEILKAKQLLGISNRDLATFFYTINVQKD